MNNWRFKLMQFMQGRYGVDPFGKFLLMTGMILLFASSFVRSRLAYFLGIAMLVYAYFRIVSKNHSKRFKENLKFEAIKSKFSGPKVDGSRGSKKKWQQAQAQQQTYGNAGQQSGAADDTQFYNYYRCRNCQQIVRVPKGQGTVKITCPKCGNSFTDRT